MTASRSQNDSGGSQDENVDVKFECEKSFFSELKAA